eukprot:COSAG06_NODE_1127_length_10605_cov_14263.444413_7_plen_192_part_00
MAVVKALARNGEFLRAKTSSGVTALIAASERGHLDVVEALISVLSKANLDEEDNDHKRTALWTSAHEGHIGIVRALLEAEADVQKRDKHGRTALIIAARENKSDCVAALLEGKADPNARDHRGRSALWVAAQGGMARTVERLIHTRRQNGEATVLLDLDLPSFRSSEVEGGRWLPGQEYMANTSPLFQACC